MSQIEWYYARDNKQLGPVSSVELKRLATIGEVGRDDLVWREGMTEWAAAWNVRGLFEEESRDAASSAAGDLGPTIGKPHEAPPARHLFDVLMDKCRPHFNARFVETTAGVFRMCGSYGLLVAAAVTAAFALIAATKFSALGHLLWGATWVLAWLALQYAAARSFGAIDQVNRTTGGRLSSSVLPDCLAMLSKVVGVAVLFGSVVAAVETSLYAMILFGVAAFFVCAYLTVVAMNPATLNIFIAPEAVAGEEAIGAIMFLLKAHLQLAPVIFGAGVVCGTLLMGVACYEAFASQPSVGGAGGALLFDGLASAAAARHALIFSGALPLIAYLVFLLGNLVLNLWRSLLSLPGKLDRLAEKNENEPNSGEDETVTTT